MIEEKGSDNLYQAFQNTILLIVVVTIVTFAMALIFAAILSREKIKGAGRFRLIFSITLPLIWTNIRTTLTFFIISTINMSFLYQEAYTNSSYGYGMAIGAVVFIFSFALAGVLNAVTKRDEIEF